MWPLSSTHPMYRNVVLITLEPEDEFLRWDDLNSTSLAVFSLNTNNEILASSLLLIFRQFSSKVMHRIITIKKELLKYKLASEDKCPFCLNPDSTEHSFIYRQESNEFFSKTLGWFNEYYTENVWTKIANFPGAWHANIMHLSVPTTFKQRNFI